MLKVSSPTPSHFGIYVAELDKMVAFYTEVFELTITDAGGQDIQEQAGVHDLPPSAIPISRKSGLKLT